ncbi:MAG TPA: TIGR01777 family oxidoreductase [Verrucomicrobiae bacterium]|nr:TIGR01777 family oxidoreductase [Verrucomicrobiae bacterium]
MRVLVLGASGFVGKHLLAALSARGDDVRAASLRQPESAAQMAGGCDAIVNLAGSNVAQKWTDQRKREILESRTEAPRRFLIALGGVEHRPSVYVSASAVGYYGTSETETFTEQSGPGAGFLAGVCVRWEAEAGRVADMGMRVAIVRTGIALGSDGGALAKLLPPFRLGVGGIVGSGKQWMSWIHIDDLVAIYLLAIDKVEGVVNASAPKPVTNAEFTKTLGSVLHRPTLLPVPMFALRALLGEGIVTVTQGQRALPSRTQSLGYTFKYSDLKPALENILA